jgi:hypothetical protein
MDDPNVVSPGILGFLAFFLLAIALIFLVRNMNGHLRRMKYRADALAADEAEQAEKQPEKQPEKRLGDEPPAPASPAGPTP